MVRLHQPGGDDVDDVGLETAREGQQRRARASQRQRAIAPQRRVVISQRVLDTGKQQRMHGAEEGECRDLPVARVRGQLDQIRFTGHHTGQLAVQRRAPKLLRIGERRADRIEALHKSSITELAPT
jgi:hypothetical protein